MRKTRLYYYYRLLRWKALHDRSPIGAAIKITQRCNLRCSHCAWEKKTDDALSFREWKKIIDSLYRKGVAVIAVEGGEPTLHPDARQIVSYIRKRGMYCILITNGTRDISHYNPDVFWISVDGMERTHDEIRGMGNFARVLRTIEANPERKMISLTSLSRRNVKDIEPLCSFLSTRLSGLMFNFTYPYGSIAEETLARRERIAAADVLIRLKERYPKLLNSTSYLESVGKEKRMHPWLLTTVSSEGREVQGCPVKQLEEEDCSRCDMGCCIELSKVFELRRDSIAFWNLNVGLPRFV